MTTDTDTRTDTRTWHEGPCGLHLFTDLERARVRRCEVCAAALHESVSAPTPRRHTEAQLAHARKPAPPQTSKILAGMIRASRARRASLAVTG